MTEKEREERDAKILKTLALLRVIVFEQAIPFFFRGFESTAHTVLTKYARPDIDRPAYLHYFLKTTSPHPMPGQKFIALTPEGAAKAGMDGKKIQYRSWGFGSALDLHLASSVYVLDSLLARDKDKLAMHWERDELQKIFGVTFPSQVPWIVRKHIGKPVVFRAYSGADAAEVRRTLREMREHAIGPLVECGDVGLLVFAPTEEAKQHLAKELKPLMREVRMIVHESPNSQTVVKYAARYCVSDPRDVAPPDGDDQSRSEA